MRAIMALALVTVLAGCGVRNDLKPQAGKTLPVAPYGREEPKGATALLDPSQQALPERSVELRRRSEKREDDPFDLPPKE
jgi:hypothetical protein